MAPCVNMPDSSADRSPGRSSPCTATSLRMAAGCSPRLRTSRTPAPMRLPTSAASPYRDPASRSGGSATIRRGRASCPVRIPEAPPRGRDTTRRGRGGRAPRSQAVLAELEDPLLDVSQPILAEEDLVPDEERRCPERAALDRALRVREELVLDLAGLDQLEESLPIQPRLLERRAEHARVVHLLGIGPHVPKDLVDVPVEYTERSSGDGTAHQRQGVHGEERVRLKAGDPMPAYEAAHLEPLVFRLVLDPCQAFRRRAIVGELEDAAQQNRHVLDLDPGASLDLGNHQLAQAGLGAAEVEMKFHLDHRSPFLAGGTDLELEGPGVGGLLVEVPVRIRHGVGPHEPAGSETVERRFPPAFPDPLADPGGVDAGIDDEVSDVNVLRSELPGGALRERSQAEFRAGEGRVPDAPAKARGGAREEDASAPTPHHEASRFSPGQEA